MIAFSRQPLACAVVLVAGVLVSAANPGWSATKRTVAPPPVFPLALAQQVVLPAMPLGAPSTGAGLAILVASGGDVVAIDLETGLETWRTPLEATHRAVVAGDAVYAVTADSVECLALADGAVRWRTPNPHAATAPPLATEQFVIVATAQPAISAFATATGRPAWSRALDGRIVQPLVSAAGRVFGVTDRHGVVATDVSSGAAEWSLTLAAPLAGLAEASNRVYVGSDDNFFYALDAATGRIQWKWRTGADVVGAAATDADHVYFVSLDNLLRALDRSSGAQRWKRALPTRSVAGPLLFDRVLLVVGYSTDVRGHVPETGAAAGRYGTDGEIAFQPTLAPGAWPGADRLVLVTQDRTLLVLRRRLDPPLAPLDALPGAAVAVSDPPAPASPAPPPLP